MRYYIEYPVDEIAYKHGGDHYLHYLKAGMVRELAGKMMEVFGAKPTQAGRHGEGRVMVFDVVIGERYETDRAEKYGERKGFKAGYEAAKAVQPWGFDEQYE